MEVTGITDKVHMIVDVYQEYLELLDVFEKQDQINILNYMKEMRIQELNKSLDYQEKIDIPILESDEQLLEYVKNISLQQENVSKYVEITYLANALLNNYTNKNYKMMTFFPTVENIKNYPDKDLNTQNIELLLDYVFDEICENKYLIHQYVPRVNHY